VERVVQNKPTKAAATPSGQTNAHRCLLGVEVEGTLVPSRRQVGHGNEQRRSFGRADGRAPRARHPELTDWLTASGGTTSHVRDFQARPTEAQHDGSSGKIPGLHWILTTYGGLRSCPIQRRPLSWWLTTRVVDRERRPEVAAAVTVCKVRVADGLHMND